MRVLRPALMTLAAWLAFVNGAAFGQTAPPVKPVDKDIVVTGRKPLNLKDATQFARHASVAVDGQLAKFNSPVCPMALGFPEQLARQIEDRMADVALAAGASVAKRGCKGNMLLIAADDGAALVREMRRVDNHLIHGLDFHEVRALIKAPGPAWSWTFTALENEDGQTVSSPIGGGMPTLAVYTGSHINPPTRQSIGMAIVVIDWKAMMGKTGVQVADYAAMRTLAKTNPVAGGGSVDTILALFGENGATLPELSAADLAYLQSLYFMPGMRHDYYQLGRIARDVRKAATAEQ